MTRQQQSGVAPFDINPWMESLALGVIFLLAITISAAPTHAQTFSIIHNFTVSLSLP